MKTLPSFDFKFFVLFAGLFFIFYYGCLFIAAAASPGGTYIPFVEYYLNFPIVIRDCILFSSKQVLWILGYSTTINIDRISSVDGRSILEMAWPCLGLSIKSFWVAFVLAHQKPATPTLKWIAIGVLTIFLLNCIRVAFMMISMVEEWTIAEYLGTNAHDLFNYICYAALAVLIFIYYKKSDKKTTNESKTDEKSKTDGNTFRKKIANNKPILS